MLLELTNEELKELIEKSLEKRTISGKDGEKLQEHLQKVDEFVDDYGLDCVYWETILKDSKGNYYALYWRTYDGNFCVEDDCNFYKVELVKKVIIEYKEVE